MRRNSAATDVHSGCDHCGSPHSGAGLRGRAWSGLAPGTYCCYGCLSLGEQERRLRQSPTADRPKLGGLGFRLGIAMVVAGQSTTFGLALNLHDDVPTAVRWAVQSLILASTMLVVALLGVPLFRAAISELRRGRITVEALFLLTMTGALSASLQAHFSGTGKVYFEVVSILLVVYTVGKLVGSRSRARAIEASHAWCGELRLCRRIDDRGRAAMTVVSEIVPGDVVEVHAGESIPVDGTIQSGTGFASEAPVSGEPFAVIRRPGDGVLAGTISFDATFRIRASHRGTERQIDRLLAAMERARTAPLSLQSQADRLAQWFLPLIAFTSLGTFIYWTAFSPRGWEAGLFNAMSVLLVACPCAIGLTTPLAIWTALGRLAERGLLVRSGDALERLAEVDCVFLDKTGTLTEDGLRIREIVTAVRGEEREKLLGWLAAVESHSDHPIAKPFAELAREVDGEVVSVRTIPGKGIEAAILDSLGTERSIRMGRPEWISPGLVSDEAEHRIDVEVDGIWAAKALLVERVRPTAAETLEQFQALGLTGEILTGDRSARTALPVGFVVERGLLPDEKHQRIASCRAAGGKPLMVGDGINDASALAAAHVGIALASGTDLAVEAADATLYGGDLRVLPWAVAVSRDAVRTIRFGLARAALYNLIGIALAAAGVLHPIVAVLLMMVSSLSLIASSARVRTPAFHCSNVRPNRGILARSLVHFIALAAQPFVLLALLEPAREMTVAVSLVAGFALAALGTAWVWHRWPAIPHGLDMGLGMLTLGNFGMLLGWWADSGFAPLREAGCRACWKALQNGSAAPGMWLGMLLFANAAMLGLGRRPLPQGHHVWAMFTGGNLGMLLGMIGGGWAASNWEADSLFAAVLSSFAGMTVGMLAGMIAGTWLVERLLTVVPANRGA